MPTQWTAPSWDGSDQTETAQRIQVLTDMLIQTRIERDKAIGESAALSLLVDEQETAIARLREQAGQLTGEVTQLREDTTRLRAAAWRPRAYPSKPATPEQEESCQRGEARTDWPTWIQPCDPDVVGPVSVRCGRTGRLIADIPGICAWSELVAAIAAHRCPPVDEVAPDAAPSVVSEVAIDG